MRIGTQKSFAYKPSHGATLPKNLAAWETEVAPKIAFLRGNLQYRKSLEISAGLPQPRSLQAYEDGRGESSFLEPLIEDQKVARPWGTFFTEDLQNCPFSPEYSPPVQTPTTAPTIPTSDTKADHGVKLHSMRRVNGQIAPERSVLPSVGQLGTRALVEPAPNAGRGPLGHQAGGAAGKGRPQQVLLMEEDDGLLPPARPDKKRKLAQSAPPPVLAKPQGVAPAPKAQMKANPAKHVTILEEFDCFAPAEHPKKKYPPNPSGKPPAGPRVAKPADNPGKAQAAPAWKPSGKAAVPNEGGKPSAVKQSVSKPATKSFTKPPSRAHVSDGVQKATQKLKAARQEKLEKEKAKDATRRLVKAGTVAESGPPVVAKTTMADGPKAAQLGKSEPVQASADPPVRPASSGEPAPKLPPIKIRFKLPPKKDAGTEAKKDAGPETRKDAGSGGAAAPLEQRKQTAQPNTLKHSLRGLLGKLGNCKLRAVRKSPSRDNLALMGLPAPVQPLRRVTPVTSEPSPPTRTASPSPAPGAATLPSRDPSLQSRTASLSKSPHVEATLAGTVRPRARSAGKGMRETPPIAGKRPLPADLEAAAPNPAPIRRLKVTLRSQTPTEARPVVQRDTAGQAASVSQADATGGKVSLGPICPPLARAPVEPVRSPAVLTAPQSTPGPLPGSSASASAPRTELALQPAQSPLVPEAQSAPIARQQGPEASDLGPCSGVPTTEAAMSPVAGSIPAETTPTGAPDLQARPAPALPHDERALSTSQGGLVAPGPPLLTPIRAQGGTSAISESAPGPVSAKAGAGDSAGVCPTMTPLPQGSREALQTQTPLLGSGSEPFSSPVFIMKPPSVAAATPDLSAFCSASSVHAEVASAAEGIPAERTHLAKPCTSGCATPCAAQGPEEGFMSPIGSVIASARPLQHPGATGTMARETPTGVDELSPAGEPSPLTAETAQIGRASGAGREMPRTPGAGLPTPGQGTIPTAEPGPADCSTVDMDGDPLRASQAPTHSCEAGDVQTEPPATPADLRQGDATILPGGAAVAGLPLTTPFEAQAGEGFKSKPAPEPVATQDAGVAAGVSGTAPSNGCSPQSAVPTHAAAPQGSGDAPVAKPGPVTHQAGSRGRQASQSETSTSSTSRSSSESSSRSRSPVAQSRDQGPRRNRAQSREKSEEPEMGELPDSGRKRQSSYGRSSSRSPGRYATDTRHRARRSPSRRRDADYRRQYDTRAWEYDRRDRYDERSRYYDRDYERGPRNGRYDSRGTWVREDSRRDSRHRSYDRSRQVSPRRDRDRDRYDSRASGRSRSPTRTRSRSQSRPAYKSSSRHEPSYRDAQTDRQRQRSDRLEARHDSRPLETPMEPAGRKGSTQPAGLPLSHPDAADAGSAPSVENDPPETAADGSLGAFSAAARAAKTSAHTAGAPSAAVAPVVIYLKVKDAGTQCDLPQPALSEKMIQTDLPAEPRPAAVGMADVLAFMEGGIHATDVPEIKVLMDMATRQKRFADQLLKRSSERWLIHACLTYLNSALNFMAATSSVDNGNTALSIHSQTAAMLQSFVIGSLDRHKWGDPDMRTFIRLMADRVICISHLRFEHSQRLRLKQDRGQLLEQLKVVGKPSPTESAKSTTTCTAPASASPTDGLGAAPSAVGPKDMIVPAYLVESQERLLKLSQITVKSWDTFKRTTEDLRALGKRVGPPLQAAVASAILMTIDGGVSSDVRLVLWAGREALRAVQSMIPEAGFLDQTGPKTQVD